MDIHRSAGAADEQRARRDQLTERPATAHILVVQPGDDDPLGRFEGWLRGCGLDIHTIRPFAGDTVPQQLSADALIVLGGDMSSTDDAHFPWLEDIRALLRDAAARPEPTLGICLGAQLLAQALGGTVAKGTDGTEAGLVTVSLTAEAVGDRLFDGLGPDIPVASMHGDAITVLPDDAVLLGTGSTYPHQAFRAATNAWGVQFHPEISPETYAQWAVAFRSSDPTQTHRVAQGVDDLASGDLAVQRVAAHLASRFADLITG